MSDEAKRLGTPTASNFTGEDAQSLRPRPWQFGVGNALAPFRDSDGGAIASGSRRLGPALACQRRHERHVATQRLAKRSGPVHDKVEAAAIGGVNITR